MSDFADKFTIRTVVAGYRDTRTAERVLDRREPDSTRRVSGSVITIRPSFTGIRTVFPGYLFFLTVHAFDLHAQLARQDGVEQDAQQGCESQT